MKPSLTVRLLTTILPIVALCLTATAIIAIKGSEAVIDRFAARYGQDIAESQKSRIRNHFTEAGQPVETLAQVITAMIANDRQDRAVVADMVRRTAIASDRSVGVWFFAEPDTMGPDASHIGSTGIATADPRTGRFMPYYARRGDREGFEPAPEEFEDEYYYSTPRLLGRGVVTPPYWYPIFEEDVLIASYVVPVIVDGRFMGIAGIDFDLMAMARFFGALRPLGGSVRLIIGNGTWVYSPDPALVGTTGASAVDPLSNLSPEEAEFIRAGTPFQRDIVVTGADGTELVVRRIAVPLTYVEGEPLSRMLLVDLPLTELMRPFEAIRTTIAVAGVISLLLVWAAVLLAVRAHVGEPLQRIQQTIRRLEAGDFRQTGGPLNRPDAIGEVARALDEFRRSLIDQKDMQATLTRQAAEMRRLTAAIDAAQDGIVIFDPSFHVLYANDATLRQLNAPNREAVIGKRWRTLIDPEVQAVLDRMEPRMPEVLRREGYWTGIITDWRSIFGGRTEALEGRATLLQDGTILMAYQDVSEKLRTERETKLLEARMAQQQKLEAVGRLAGGIAHDFNNLLGAIMGYLEFLVADLPEGSPQHGYAERAVKAGNRAKDMVRHLLSFARPGSGDIGPVGPQAVIAETKGLLTPTLPASVNLSLNATPHLPPVKANATQIVQVLMNLAINARDASREGQGRISITAYRIDADTESVPPGTEGWPVFRPLEPPPAPLVCFEVRDEGQGIPEDVLATIFEPFFSTKGRKGTGLGLAMVFGIVKSHGGGLEVRSSAGEGTVFRIFLPAVEEPQTVAIPQTPTDAAPLGGGRVLVVDDEVELGDMLEQGLGRLGFEVAVCESAEEALDVFEEEPVAFDAVLTDQTMTGASGMSLIGRLKSIRPDLPCVVYTGFSEHLDEAAALRGGADAFFTKPVQVKVLADTLTRLIAQHAVRKDPPADG